MEGPGDSGRHMGKEKAREKWREIANANHTFAGLYWFSLGKHYESFYMDVHCNGYKGLRMMLELCVCVRPSNVIGRKLMRNVKKSSKSEEGEKI